MRATLHRKAQRSRATPMGLYITTEYKLRRAYLEIIKHAHAYTYVQNLILGQKDANRQ